MRRAALLLVLVVVGATASSAGARTYRSWTTCTSSIPARSELACASHHLRHATDVLRFLANHPEYGTSTARARVLRNHRWLASWARTRISEARARLEPPLVYGAGEELIAPIIRAVFGAYGSQAVEVSRCETGGKFNTDATNGQYLGIFQMGTHERATYGGRLDAVGAAEAAWRYFDASGRDWSPWSCKP